MRSKRAVVDRDENSLKAQICRRRRLHSQWIIARASPVVRCESGCSQESLPGTAPLSHANLRHASKGEQSNLSHRQSMKPYYKRVRKFMQEKRYEKKDRSRDR